MAAEKEVDVPSLMDASQEKLDSVKASLQQSETDTEKELSILRNRAKSSATALSFLKSKAKIMDVPHLAPAYCGTTQLGNAAIADKNGVDITSSEEEDNIYTSELISSINMIGDVMESLVKRAVMAETEAAAEKERANLGHQENMKKLVQIENMSLKLEEMEKFASGANEILNEMRQRVDGLVEETSRQRQRAAENETELSRVKRDFENLKAYVGTLISVRETLVSSEKQFHTIEMHFERLVAKNLQLETEKMQKEAEVHKLVEENVRLSSQLDDKEAQLVAMSEQCKVMALSASEIN